MSVSAANRPAPTRNPGSADERLIVAIDGPAGAGKSTVTRHAAKRLGLEFLDTGAMYRAATALALDRGVDTNDEQRVPELAREAQIRFDWTTDPPTLLAFDAPMCERLRDRDVDGAVSAVSGIAALRTVMVDLQQRIGEAHPRLITEGRDQGSVVFPNAHVKIFLDASAEARARRRAQQLRKAGHEADERAILRDLEQRDLQDMSRKVGPLVCPIDAVRVDTSDLTLEQVVERIVEIVEQRCPGARPPARNDP
ncbi:MAG: (d)CMP kinase [Phycisphaerales bacterium]|nr:MAG: (d)CMP kinase [Phycisphaerales bacterium]